MDRSDERSRLTVAEIIKRNAASLVQRYQPHPQVQSTLAKLSLCRTAALGMRQLSCDQCQQAKTTYNSCGDRHCPTCSGARRSDWLESTARLVFDGVDHFQVVFTLPSELSSLALGNRKLLYDLLFSSSWRALKQTIADEHGYQAAAVMVLHTWNQKLDAHAHVHAVVPGCGPAIDRSGIALASKRGEPESVGCYLVDAETLRTTFRDLFLKGLNRLQQGGKLKLDGSFEPLRSEANWSSFLGSLQQVDWVSFIQAPPQPNQSAEHVLKYLARYLAGGPISDSRIISTDETNVTFMARAGEVSGGERKQIPITLTQLEFTRRWCLHVLPKGYTRTRRFGGWCNIHREQFLERFAMQLEATDVPLSPTAMEFGPYEVDSSKDDLDHLDPELANQGSSASHGQCESCGGRLIPHREIPKPSWDRVMASPYRPSWY